MGSLIKMGVQFVSFAILINIILVLVNDSAAAWSPKCEEDCDIYKTKASNCCYNPDDPKKAVMYNEDCCSSNNEKYFKCIRHKALGCPVNLYDYNRRRDTDPMDAQDNWNPQYH